MIYWGLNNFQESTLLVNPLLRPSTQPHGAACLLPDRLRSSTRFVQNIEQLVPVVLMTKGECICSELCFTEVRL